MSSLLKPAKTSAERTGPSLFLSTSLRRKLNIKKKNEKERFMRHF